MKNTLNLRIAAACLALFVSTIGCNAPTNETAKPDLVKIKAEIQAIENDWAKALNARDTAASLVVYSDDAISMGNDRPMVIGKAALQKDIAEGMTKMPKGMTLAFETLEVFGDDNLVTEVGKTIEKDSTGAVMLTGKYMAIFEKRGGKFICIRDISNNDQKAK